MRDVRQTITYPHRVLRRGRLFVPVLLATVAPFLVVELLVFVAEPQVGPYRAYLTTGLVVLGAAYYAGIQTRVFRHVVARDPSRVSLSDRNGIRRDTWKLLPLAVLGFGPAIFAAALAGVDPAALFADVAAGRVSNLRPGGPLELAGVAIAAVGAYLLPAAQGGLAEDAPLDGRFLRRRLFPVLRSPRFAGFWLFAVSLALAGVVLVVGVLSVVASAVSTSSGAVVPPLLLVGVVLGSYVVTGASAVAAHGYARAREHVVANEPTEGGTAWGRS
jgi:hypothetical protein